MCQPDQARAGVPAGGKAVEKANLRGVDIVLRQWLEMLANVAAGNGELRRNRVHAGGDGALMAWIVPLHDVVVLDPHDRKAVEIVRPDQGLDIRDMQGRYARLELDDDAPGRDFQIQGVVRIGGAPILWRGVGEQVAHGYRFGDDTGGRGQEEGEQQANSVASHGFAPAAAVAMSLSMRSRSPRSK